MKMCPTITVIIPVFNVAKWLPECLDSIINQSYRKLEIIVVDDGSTDESGKICDHYGRIDDRIKVIHQKNGGLSAARNAGIDAASGDYIVFIDSDDYVNPKHIEYLYTLISKLNSDMSVCQLYYVDENGNVIPHVNDCNDNKTVNGNFDCMKEYLSGNAIGTVACRKLYRKDLFDDGIRFPVGRYNEDVWTTYKLIAKCNSIAIGSKELYAYRQRQGSIMNSKFSPKHMDAVYGAIEKNAFVEKYYPALAHYTARDIIYASNVCSRLIAYSKPTNYKRYVDVLQPLYRKYLKYFLSSSVKKISKLYAVLAYINLNILVLLIKRKCR